MRGLVERTILITGGGSGIGAAASHYLASKGSNVVVADRNADSADKVVSDITKSGGSALSIGMDITDGQEVRARIDELLRREGRIEALVNNAGWDSARDFVETDAKLWRHLIEINLVGHLNVTQAVLPAMIAQKLGRITFVGSDAARVGSSGEAVYSACKGGLISFCKSLAREVARLGITSNTVCPGLTNTPLLAEVLGSGDEGRRLREGATRAIPMRRVGEPEELAGLIAYFCSDESSYVTGQVVSVSGGLTMSG